jgi:P4 family phage/plasmid primase-like protien
VTVDAGTGLHEGAIVRDANGAIPVVFAGFTHIADDVGDPGLLSFDAFEQWVKAAIGKHTCPNLYPDEAAHRKAKGKLPYFTQCTFRGTRCQANANDATVLVFDLDSIGETELGALLGKLHGAVRGFAYASPSDGQKPGRCVRIVLALDEALPDLAFDLALKGFAHHMKIPNDDKTERIEHAFFLGRPEGRPERQFWTLPGRALPAMSVAEEGRQLAEQGLITMREAPKNKVPDEVIEGLPDASPDAVALFVEHLQKQSGKSWKEDPTQPKNARYTHCVKGARFGLNVPQIEAAMLEHYLPRHHCETDDHVLRQNANNAVGYVLAEAETAKAADLAWQANIPLMGDATTAPKAVVPATNVDPWEFAGTEQGDAALFAAKHAGRIRYVEAWSKYIGWDGKRWTLEGGERLARTAWRDNLRDMLRDAAKETDPDRVKKLTEYARKRMTSAAEESTIKLAKALLHVNHKSLDADPYVLNLENGILDLRTMQLGPHDPAKLCTRLAPVLWEPGATCPAWLSFLNWAMCGRQDLIDYLQRFFGLCLSGDSSHEKLHVFFGDGSNGKTTVIMVAEGMLGDYAARAPSKLLMKARHEAHPTEIADFAGCRMVTLAETEEDQQIDEQILKLIASKDPTKARRMREDFWEFEPTHKSILLTNHKPRVLGQDRGAWRRLVLVPWEATIEDDRKDTQLPNRLKDTELPGILQWAAAGYLAVQRDGLRPPKPVQDATAGYRIDEDTVARFVESECERGAEFSVQARPLCESFNAWARSGRSGLLSERAVAKRMTALGFAKEARKDATYWIGVRLRQGGALAWSPPAANPIYPPRGS